MVDDQAEKSCEGCHYPNCKSDLEPLQLDKNPNYSLRLPPIENEYLKANMKVPKLQPISVSTTKKENVAFEVKLGEASKTMTAKNGQCFCDRSTTSNGNEVGQIANEVVKNISSSLDRYQSSHLLYTNSF